MNASKPAFLVAIGGVVHETNQFVGTLTTLDALRGRSWRGRVHGPHGGGAQLRRWDGDCSRRARSGGGRHALRGGGAMGHDRRRRLCEFAARGSSTRSRPSGRSTRSRSTCMAPVSRRASTTSRATSAVLSAIASDPDVLLVVTHDLHGHISDLEAAAVDALFPVHEYPHDDMYDRGHEAIEWISRQLERRVQTSVHVERLPMLIPTTTTYRGVGRDAMEVCLELEQQPDVVDVAFMHGFPYTDNRHVGAQVVASSRATAHAPARWPCKPPARSGTCESASPSTTSSRPRRSARHRTPSRSPSSSTRPRTTPAAALRATGRICCARCSRRSPRVPSSAASGTRVSCDRRRRRASGRRSPSRSGARPTRCTAIRSNAAPT